MVFCAYCGKSFTRKEHLERHIPSHTNVKPHRCTNCQLSFARRDLLQRHYATYHEIRDPSLPLPPSIPAIAGRTPIACLNCASAKTGCDKRVPCSRCADKSLPCAARFARRSSKLIARALAASEASSMAVDTAGEASVHASKSAPESSTKDIEHVIDPQLQSPIVPGIPIDGYGDPTSTKIESFDDYMHYNDGLGSPGHNYAELLTWNDFPIDMELYGDQSMPSEALHPLYSGEITSSSGSVRSSVSNGPRPSTSQTRRCSRSSSGELDFDEFPVAKRQKLSLCAAAPEFDEVLAAELAWPLARCNPPTYSGTCPRTAVVHLESLEQNSKHGHGWDFLGLSADPPLQHVQNVRVEPISLGTRETLNAITQGFLHRALKTHRGGLSTKGQNTGDGSPGNFSFLLLPPTNVLEYFLETHARSFSPYYSLAAGGKIDLNELVYGNQASSLLVLLMIAQGAAADGSLEAKCLSAGLTETCRISLFDIIERDIELCANPIVLRCALIFTMLGAWGGDKWHMDIVMGQRGMYLAMLKHAGMLESVETATPSLSKDADLEQQWRSWMQAETRRRLVYDWVLVDQELALFHDLGTILSISELQASLPHSNVDLFHAPTSSQWPSQFSSTSASQSPLHYSLHDLFQDFLHDTLTPASSLSHLTLRLLLHPIQSLLYQVRQVLTCFPDVLATRRPPNRNLSKASTLSRLEEVQLLLQKWYTIHSTLPVSAPGSNDELVKTTNLILYHLISLNAHTSFPALEHLARRASATIATPNPYWELSLQHKKCIHDSSSALFHCGQVFRLLSSLAPSSLSSTTHDSSAAMGAPPLPDRRPSWAPVAIYRATLVLWADVLSKSDPSFPQSPSLGPLVVINDLPADDTGLMAWLWAGEGTPAIRDRDGRAAALLKPEEVLEACISHVVGGREGGGDDDGFGASKSRLADGVIRKLKVLKENWHGPGGLISL